MATKPIYTGITKKGLEAIVDASSNGTLIELKYCLPIYDYRADASVSPVGFIDQNININSLYPSLDITHSDLFGELLYNGDYPYSLLDAHTSASAGSFDYVPATSATTKVGTTISNVPYGSLKPVNIVNSNPVWGNGWKIFNQDYIWQRTTTSITNVTSASSAVAANPNNPTSAVASTNLFDKITYTSLSNDFAVDNSIKSRACYSVLFDETISSDFKFNVIAVYGIKRNANYTISNSTPFLFAVTVLPNVIIKSNTITNAIQNVSFDLNIDYTFTAVDSSFNKILYVDSSDQRSISWHTKSNGTIGTTRDVAIFDAYNADDYTDLSKLLIGVTKYRDGAGNVITTIPSVGEVFQDQSDPFPSNWAAYKVLTTPTESGYEITFEGDYAASITSLMSGSGSGFGSLFAFYTKSGTFANPNYPSVNIFMAPSLGKETTDIIEGITERWDSVNTLNGMTAKNAGRVHPLWNYVSNNGLGLRSAQDYANDYGISAEVISGFRSSNLSFTVDNTFEFWFSDEPAYSSVAKISRDASGNVITSNEDVWTPYYGTLTGDVYNHWKRNSANNKVNKDLFIRSDVTQDTANSDANSLANGDIYILAGFDDQSPMHAKSASMIWQDDKYVALRRLLIKATDIVHKGNIIPGNIGSTIGEYSNPYGNIFTKKLNDMWGMISYRGTPALYAAAPSGRTGILGLPGTPLENVFTRNINTTTINNLELGWNSFVVNASTVDVNGSVDIKTSTSATVTSANVGSLITKFNYSASPDKSININIVLNGILKRTSNSAIPYLELKIKDSEFLRYVSHGTANGMKLVLALPYISQGTTATTYLNDTVNFTFNADAVSTKSICTCPLSLNLTPSTLDFQTDDWWINGTSTIPVVEETIAYGVLTSDMDYTFTNFNSWYVSNRALLLNATSANYSLPIWNDTTQTFNYSAHLPSSAASAQEFVKWLNMKMNDNISSPSYVNAINTAFNRDMTSYDMAYSTFNDIFSVSDVGKTFSKTTGAVIPLWLGLVVPNKRVDSLSNRITLSKAYATSGSTAPIAFDTMFNASVLTSADAFHIIGFTGYVLWKEILLALLSLYKWNSSISNVIPFATWYNDGSSIANSVYSKAYSHLFSLAAETSTFKGVLADSAGEQISTDASSFMKLSEENVLFNTVPGLMDRVAETKTSILTSLGYNPSIDTETSSGNILDTNIAVLTTLTIGTPITSATSSVDPTKTAKIAQLDNYRKDILNIKTYNYGRIDAPEFTETWDNQTAIIIVEKNISVPMLGATTTDIFGAAANDVYASFENGYALVPKSKVVDSTYTYSFRNLFCTKTQLLTPAPFTLARGDSHTTYDGTVYHYDSFYVTVYSPGNPTPSTIPFYNGRAFPDYSVSYKYFLVFMVINITVPAISVPLYIDDSGFITTNLAKMTGLPFSALENTQFINPALNGFNTVSTTQVYGAIGVTDGISSYGSKSQNVLNFMA